MNCDRIEQDGVIERYLAGRLAEPDHGDWELHYFSCDRCFARLEAMSLARKALQETQKTVPLPRRRPVWRAAIGIAAALLVGIVLWNIVPIGRPPQMAGTRSAGPGSYANARLLALARIDPPAYSAQQMRGAEEVALRRFREAMVPYERGEYGAAAEALRGLSRQDAAPVDVWFFLGAVELMEGNASAARSALNRVAAAADTPYREEALFYLAKTDILEQKVQEATLRLLEVAKLEGDWKSAAEQVLAELETLR